MKAAQLTSNRLAPIWQRLLDRLGEWVPAPELIALTHPTSISAAISEIRQRVEPDGWNIDQKYSGETCEGRRRSLYRAVRIEKPKETLF